MLTPLKASKERANTQRPNIRGRPTKGLSQHTIQRPPLLLPSRPRVGDILEYVDSPFSSNPRLTLLLKVKGINAQLVPVYCYDPRFPNVVYIRDNESEKGNVYMQPTPGNGRPSGIYQFPLFKGPPPPLPLTLGPICTNHPRPLRVPSQAHVGKSRTRHHQRQIRPPQPRQPLQRHVLHGAPADLARGRAPTVDNIGRGLVRHGRHRAVGPAARAAGGQLVEADYLPGAVGGVYHAVW